MHKLHNVSERSIESYFSGSHIELSCIFSYGDEAVEVSSPVALFTPTTPTTILQPFALDSDIQPSPKYTIKFLTSGMAAGNYKVSFLGNYQSHALATTGEFNLYAVASIQNLIETLRSLLKDQLPQLYIVHLPEADTFKWRDGELYDCLLHANEAMNNTPPVNLRFEIDQNPFKGFLINIAMMFALNQRSMLEIANVINYSDEVSFNIDRDSKYSNKAQMFSQQWWASWLMVKKDYAFHSIQSHIVTSTRYPLHFIRPLSMLPNSKNTFGWY